jgi:GNAT superfamily N-acetyltransferase
MDMTENLVIRSLVETDCEKISAAFTAQGWNKPLEQYKRYLRESGQGKRDVFVAEIYGQFAGYVTLVWESDYPHFLERKIPEIVDLNVLKLFQRQGIASALMDAAEFRASTRSLVVGLGVGLTADYGPAQRMYIKRGYVPDGHGAFSGGIPLLYGESVRVNDDLVLYMTRVVTPPPAAGQRTAEIPADPQFQSKLKSIQEMLENL